MSGAATEPVTPAELCAEARRLHLAGRSGDAERLYRRAVDIDARHAPGWFGLGAVAIERGDAGDAVVLIERAMAIDGPKAAYHHNLGAAKASLGRLAEAETHYEEALRLQPDAPRVYFNYAGIRRFEEGHDLLERIERQLAQPGRDAVALNHLHFAAGKLLDDRGDYRRAFEHYRAGNEARERQHDRARHRDLVERTLRVFDAALLDRLAGAGHDDDRFVFVVGMPRCGSSLLEQMLSAHPDVHGGGELRDVPSIAVELARRHGGEERWPECAREFTPAEMRGFGAAYAERVGGAAGPARRCIDKALNNHLSVGLIHLLLPKARVIHCRRHPLDTCLSCYFNNFRSGHDYSFDFDDLAAMYADYRACMRHWQALLPDVVLDVDYERVVHDPEHELRRVLDFIGLPWHPAALDHTRVRRAVSTASKWQVRQPLYRASVGRARHYLPWLGPLADALRREGVTDLELGDDG